VCLKYLDLSLLTVRVDFRAFQRSRYQLVHRTNKRSWTLRNRKHSITFRTCSSVRFCFFAAVIVRQTYLDNRAISRGVFSAEDARLNENNRSLSRTLLPRDLPASQFQVTACMTKSASHASLRVKSLGLRYATIREGANRDSGIQSG